MEYNLDNLGKAKTKLFFSNIKNDEITTMKINH